MIAAVVLAAGSSTRMGRPKQTLLLKGVPILERVLKVLRKSRVDLTVVVLGANADEVRRKVKLEDERVVVNYSHSAGMSESLKLGLRAVEGADAALVVLADQPFVKARTVDKMISAYLRSRPPVVVPVYRGRRGNPVLFDRGLFERIMMIQGDVGARSVVEENREKLVEVKVDDEGVLIDLDTPADYVLADNDGRIRSRKSPEAT